MPRIYTLSLLLLCASLTALDEAPRGLFAIATDERDSIAGSGVLLTADGLALTLTEALPETGDTVTVILPGGALRSAAIVARGSQTGAVLLQIPLQAGDPLAPVTLGHSAPLRLGSEVWTAGNSYDALIDDGLAALSRGVVSGRYQIPPGHPPMRGRRGAVLSSYRGPVIETDAAVNDGNQGGALLDASGALVGLTSLGVARQRRLGTAVPIDLIVAELPKLAELPRQGARASSDPVIEALADQAASTAESLVLVYLERPNGPGNPEGMPRPTPVSPALPRYQRERLAKLWGQYFHQQQVFFIDQAVVAAVVDPDRGMILTAASNLHGKATQGWVLRQDGATLRCSVHAVHLQLDLAILVCDEPLTEPALRFAGSSLAGDPVAVVGRHRDGGPFTMTTGVISATNRRLGQSPYPLHQTDALANYGSLGGVVINPQGEALGMITMLAPNPNWRWFINSGVAMFAGADVLQQALIDLLDGTSTTHFALFGLGIQTQWDPAQAQALVTGIHDDTGAADSQLRVGDRIESVDGIRIVESDDISRLILRHRPGESCELGVRRGDQLELLPVELRVLRP